jgi:hypothetical protein
MMEDSVDINILADVYESRMTRERASKIITEWDAKPKSDWVSYYGSGSYNGELQLDGNFTADELEAFAWCMKNNIHIMDLCGETSKENKTTIDQA